MANISYKHFTLGVEEEYMVLDPQTKELKSHEQKIVTEGQKVIKDKVKAEMHQAVVEVGTDICQNIDEACKDVSTLRHTIAQIAGDLGLWVGAAGTHPFSHWESQLITDHARYNQIVNDERFSCMNTTMCCRSSRLRVCAAGAIAAARAMLGSSGERPAATPACNNRRRPISVTGSLTGPHGRRCRRCAERR